MSKQGAMNEEQPSGWDSGARNRSFAGLEQLIPPEESFEFKQLSTLGKNKTRRRSPRTRSNISSGLRRVAITIARRA